MKRLFALQSLAIFILAIGLIAGLSGCSLLSDDFDEITVANAMDKPLAALAYERDASHLLDINPKIPIKAITPGEGIILVEPGASATLEEENIGGEYNSGKVLRLFLYEVRSDTAYAKGSLDLTYDELKQNDFRIEVSGFPTY